MKIAQCRKLEVQQGFTLVELLITMAIIAILSAIALPAYNDYVTRSQVSEGVELGGGLKAPLAAYGQEQNKWPTKIVGPTDAPQATEISGTISGKYSSVTQTVEGDFPKGALTVTINEGQAKTKTIKFVTEDGGAKWSCTEGTVDLKWRPNACKVMN